MEKNKVPSFSAKPLQLGVDYYIENACYVFTEHYLRERGFCCQNGCRHCPYHLKKENHG